MFNPELVLGCLLKSLSVSELWALKHNPPSHGSPVFKGHILCASHVPTGSGDLWGRQDTHPPAYDVSESEYEAGENPASPTSNEVTGAYRRGEALAHHLQEDCGSDTRG